MPDAIPRVERRSGRDRRAGQRWMDLARPGQHQPSWAEQRMQFITRYLFAVIAILYFSAVPERAPLFISPVTVYLLITSYIAYNTWGLYQARRSDGSRNRRRLHMWVDIGMVSVCLAIDPNVVPVSMLAYVLIIMGNGMRYGIALFRECIAVTFLSCGAVLVLRHTIVGLPLTYGVAFLIALSAFIVVYCYALMERIATTQRELVRHSRYDPLTGLLNRRGLYESAELILQLLARGNQSVTVIFADMDRFKRVNDTLGHAAGDRVLKAVGKLLVKSVRSSDLVARYGGDEFVVFLPEATAEQASRVTRSLQRQIHTLVKEIGVPFGVSFGVREVAACSTNIHDLLVEVDHDMYRAKHRRKSSETVLHTKPCTGTPSG